jgi:hypothetical protein
MRKYILAFIIILFFPLAGFSQYYLDYGAKLGVSNSLTDVGGWDQTARPFVLDMKLAETRWAFGGYLRYKLKDPWSIEADLYYLRIQGADSLSVYPGRRGRNCNFRNDIFQFSVMGEWTFFENPDLGNTYRYENAFAAYLAIGIAIFYQDPYGYGNPVDSKGNPLAGPDSYHGLGWYNLQPLQTEGVHYHKIQPGIPIAMGFNFTIKKKYRIGWSLTWTKTFTDYLDDISGHYPQPSQLTSPQAVYFSNRSATAIAEDHTLPALNNYGPGQKRGDPTNMDTYIITTVDAGYVIRGRSNFYRRHYGGIFSKNKYKVRRRRAKF